MPMSDRTFWPRLRAIFPYDEIRTMDGRFVIFTNPGKYLEG